MLRSIFSALLGGMDKSTLGIDSPSAGRMPLMEGLESRTMMSAVVHPIAVRAAARDAAMPAVHVKADNNAQQLKPVIFHGVVTATGAAIARNFILTFTKDESGQVVARLGGVADFKDAVLTGTHTDGVYHLSIETARGTLTLDGSISTDGKTLSGSFKVARPSGEAIAGTFTATRLGAVPKPAPTPSPTPKPEPTPRPAPTPTPAPVKVTVVARYQGDFKLDGQDRTMPMTVTLMTGGDGAIIAVVKCGAFGADFAVSGLAFSGDSYTATIHGEKGSTTLSVTTSNAGQTLVGTVLRTPTAGIAVGGTFSLQKA